MGKKPGHGRKKQVGGFVKILKNKAYFKRFQTKFRRRREGKTDYRARKRLAAQSKDKYNSPRYRLVVRYSNKYVQCQVVFAEMSGDKVVCSAHSSELRNYGITFGLKNFSASYCTGLLLARRVLARYGLNEMYEGNEVDGKVRTVKYGNRTLYVEDLDWETERRPLRCNLDVGITRTTLGARVFAAMKGASDGGIDVPHSVKCLIGYDRGSKKYDAKEFTHRVLGEHVMEHMTALKDHEDEEMKAKYTTLFSQYIKAGVQPEDLEDIYTKAHKLIRQQPERKDYVDLSTLSKDDKAAHRAALRAPFQAASKKVKRVRKSLSERKARVASRKAWWEWKNESDDDDDDEDEDDDDEEDDEDEE
jgi:large subunit ribosomal protein L5e